LKAVLFDLGTTLIKTAPVPEIFKRILTTHGIQVPPRDALVFGDVEEQMQLEDYKLPYAEFWRLYNMKILRRLGIQENLEELADAITNEWWDNTKIELYPEVKDTLRNLKEMRLKIGLVTNGFRKDIEEILSRTSLNGLFDVTVGVDDVSKPKPYRQIFLYALKKLGVSPQESLFIGDNPKTDYEGAEKAGLNPLLIDRNNKTSGTNNKISDLREVLKYLQLKEQTEPKPLLNEA
jgi:putative hydrolase of the HAD superfamily